MLGVVRVYSRKVNYLFQDCSEALVKIKQAFTRDKDVDLPEGAETAPLNTITLPENYDDLELFFEPRDSGNSRGDGDGDATGVGGAGRGDPASSREDITLEETDDGFATSAFEEQYAYDDRIHGDVDDDEYIVDELDPGFHGSWFRTPGAKNAEAPGRFGETDADDRNDVGLEDYDEADGRGPPRLDDFGEDDGFGDAGEYADDGVGGGGDDVVAPLPLDDDLEDEDGVRGTVVGFKTPAASEKGFRVAADGKENAPHTGSTVVLEWGKTAQKASRPPEPMKQKNASRRRPTSMKLRFDAATILDRDAVSRAIRDASDITSKRTPGVVRRVADLADDDRPFAADEERDARGHATLGFYKDAHGTSAPPETPAEARATIRGTVGYRDPLMGHRASKQWLSIRAGCVHALWMRAGERRGTGYTRDANERSGRRRLAARSVVGDADADGARRPGRLDFENDDENDFGGDHGGFDDDDGDFGADTVGDQGEPFTPCRARSAGAAADALGSEPPTPAGAPSGHVDWSVATKRMLADLAPRLRARETVDERDGSISVPTPLRVSEMTGAARNRGKAVKPRVSRSEAARIFYQVLVLKTHGFVDLAQSEAYGDIDVVAGPKLDAFD